MTLATTVSVLELGGSNRAQLIPGKSPECKCHGLQTANAGGHASSAAVSPRGLARLLSIFGCSSTQKLDLKMAEISTGYSTCRLYVKNRSESRPHTANSKPQQGSLPGLRTAQHEAAACARGRQHRGTSHLSRGCVHSKFGVRPPAGLPQVVGSLHPALDTKALERQAKCWLA